MIIELAIFICLEIIQAMIYHFKRFSGKGVIISVINKESK